MFGLLYSFKSNTLQYSPRGVVANVLDFDLLVSKVELQSRN